MNEYKVWLAKMLTLVAILFLVVSALGALKGGEKGPTVSVVELEGAIMDSSEVLGALYKEAHNPRSKGIVVRIDSPGGAVAPSEEIYAAIRKLKNEKPIVVSMGSVAASGGLYAAVGASKIFASRGTQTGSIGVIMQLPNYGAVADKIGFSMVTVKSGALKDAGNPFRPMTDAEHAFLEETAHKVHGAFIKAVADGRNLPEEKVKEFADGRVLLGSEAKDLGLIDEFGDIYDAATEALSLAGEKLDKGALPELHYANRKKGALSRLLESSSSIGEVVARQVAPTSGALLQYLSK
jgi:protease-4